MGIVTILIVAMGALYALFQILESRKSYRRNDVQLETESPQSVQDALRIVDYEISPTPLRLIKSSLLNTVFRCWMEQPDGVGVYKDYPLEAFHVPFESIVQMTQTGILNIFTKNTFQKLNISVNLRAGETMPAPLLTENPNLPGENRIIIPIPAPGQQDPDSQRPLETQPGETNIHKCQKVWQEIKERTSGNGDMEITPDITSSTDIPLESTILEEENRRLKDRISAQDAKIAEMRSEISEVKTDTVRALKDAVSPKAVPMDGGPNTPGGRTP